MNFYLVVVGVFSGKSETTMCKILIYFWYVGAGCAGSLACPLVQRWAGLSRLRTCRRLALVLWWRVPCFSSAFLLCSRCVACKYGSISHFKGVFRGFPLLDVGLYWFGALRGLWGFCVREWLGGFRACCVFAPVFILLPFSFCLSFYLFALLLSFCPCVSVSALLCLFSCLVFPALSLLVLLFLFRLYRQKERAQRFCLLRPRLSLLGVLSTPLLRQELGNYCRRFRF